MGHEFEEGAEFEVDATPEQVWESITTGPGINSWFMGQTEVEPGEDGTVWTSFGGYAPVSGITTWEPLKRFAYRVREAEDGRFMAYEFVIEGRDGGGAVIRVVTSGFIPGEDWEEEYDAMTRGGVMFHRTLVEYLTHFAGRAATPITVFAPPVTDWEQAWARLRAALELSETVHQGDRARFTLNGIGTIEGVVYFVNPDTLGLRANDALYRFLGGFHGGFVVAHSLFTPADQSQTLQAWRSWLDRVSV